MSDHDDAVAALSEAVLVTSSPQQDALAEAVARHISNRPVRQRPPADPAVLKLLREEEKP